APASRPRAAARRRAGRGGRRPRPRCRSRRPRRTRAPTGQPAAAARVPGVAGFPQLRSSRSGSARPAGAPYRVRPGTSDAAASLVERVLYPIAVHFKGSGFYSTDYGRGGRKRETASQDGDSSSSTGTDGGTAEKKTEQTEKKEKAAET